MKNLPVFLLLFLLLGLSASADDLRGADRLLCSTLQASVCLPDEGCTTVPASALNIPQFINVDVRRKTLSTTAASGENRQTPLSSVERRDGLLVMHGYEQGRAFTLLVPEASGQASFASAGEDRSVVVFGACTPAA
jgi:hypothetical protein